MKRQCLYLILSLAVAFAGPLCALGAEGEWFDLENCSMCKHMSAEEGLMDHMHWETHLIANGMLSVTTVDPEYQPAFQKAMAKMEETAKKLMSGEQMYLCGFCNSYGALQMAGAKFEDVQTDAGIIGLVTSADPQVVEMIHKHGQRTIDEFAKMTAESDEHGSHDKKSHAH